MKTTKLILAVSTLFLASAFTAQAQYRADSAPSYEPFGAQEGEWEMTLGGSGTSNKDLDDSNGGIDVSLGYYLNDLLSLSVRQSVNYNNVSGDRANYNGSTFLAVDQHFAVGNLRPFVGLNFGGIYGENTSDTWAAGIEGGLKLYVKPKTFIFALVNYAWTFEDSDDLDDQFDDGGIIWTVGIGFNF